MAQLVFAGLLTCLLLYLDHRFPRPFFGHKNGAEGTLGFFTALAGISATMLGLYFAAVSLVASTAYARVSGDIRALVVREQVGTFYFVFLAQFGANAVLLLAAFVFGLPVHTWCVCGAAFLAVFGILSFVALGLRTFEFFDPVQLAASLNKYLEDCFREVTPAGTRWDEPSFQSHFQRRAAYILESYGILITLSEQKENLNTRALPKLARGLLQALGTYSVHKSRIPTDSRWFRRQYRHKDWMTSFAGGLEVARATDTPLQPEAVPDNLWFEEEIGTVIGRILDSLCARSDATAAAELLNQIQYTLGVLANQFQLDEALQLSRRFGEILDQRLQAEVFKTDSEKEITRSAFRCALRDTHGLGLISILLGVTKNLRESPVAQAAGYAATIEWGKRASLYRAGRRPRAVLEQWEGAADKLDFEIEAVGQRVSPDWLIAEMTALGYVKFLAGAPELVLAMEQCFGGGIAVRIAAKDFIGATQLALRGFEATNKIVSHFRTWQKWDEECRKLDRSRDWKWPPADWDGLDRRVVALRRELVFGTATSLPALFELPESKILPDIFGQSYSIVADGCFDSLLTADLNGFKRLFPIFFRASFYAHEIVRRKVSDLGAAAVKLVLGPFGDALAISGYALLAGELTGSAFKDVVIPEWDRFFEKITDPERRRAYIAAFAASTDVLLGSSPREQLRFGWKRGFNDHLVAQGFHIGQDRFMPRAPRERHESSALRAYAARADMTVDAEDVFLAVYLFKRPEAAGVEKPDQVEWFERGINADTGEEEDNEAET